MAFKEYQSHKIVKAAKIVSYNKEVSKNEDATDTFLHWKLLDSEGTYHFVENEKLFARGEPKDDYFYLVKYDDDYTSWSPKVAFENGYILRDENFYGMGELRATIAVNLKMAKEELLKDLSEDRRLKFENMVEILDFLDKHSICKGVYLDIGQARKAMMAGHKVTRPTAVYKDAFVYRIPANKYPADRNILGTMAGIFPDDLVPYKVFYAIKTADNEVMPWCPSQEDLDATDWEIV